MVELWIIVFVVLAMLLVERLAVAWTTKGPRGREWIRRFRPLHPNSISVIRMPMGLIAVWLATMGWWTAAIYWFSFWMITDLTDGTIARKCDLVTESGKWLDPLSDKCMYFPALIFFSMPGVLRTPLPVAWIIALLVIDVIGQASRLFIQKKAANSFGKGKTALITILLTLIGLDQVQSLWFVSEHFLYMMTVSCTLLAFMSFYCKVIPDLWYANSLTLANFVCGLAAIVTIHGGRPLAGFVLVFVGQFFDLFDGRMARKFGSTRHGAFFDDIADGTSFGLATGYLIFRQLGPTIPLPVRLAITLLYIGCIMYRLYRFMHPTTTLPPGIFQGIPSPEGAMLGGSAALLFGPIFPWLAAAIAIIGSLLMVSTVHYKHFAHHIWPTFPRTMKLLFCILCLVFVSVAISNKVYALSFAGYCFALAFLYLIFGFDRGSRARADTLGDEPGGEPG